MIVDVKGHKVQIDASDHKLISKYKWHVGSTGYAVWRGKIDGKKQTVRMHRLITGCPRGKIVDHINHDRLDNRRANLRICTQSENMRNLRNQGRGYWRHRKNKNWVVEVYGKHIGCFSTEAEAARMAEHVRSGGTYIKPEATHCSKGHELRDAYVIHGNRRCKVCQSIRSREYYQRRKVKLEVARTHTVPTDEA